VKRRNILIGLAAATLLIALGTGLTAAQGKANAGTTAMDTVLPKRRTAGNVAKKQACVIYDLSTPGESTVEVPSFCTDGMCMISVYHDAIMGAFAPGLSWPLYYRQDSTDDSWVGGPNIALGGVSFSDGAGVNGDGSSDAVFIGGTSTDGGYVRVYDDGASESSPDLWTIESMPSELFTEASLYVCAMPSCVQHNVSAEAEWAVEVPDFCIDDMCTVLMWHDATFDAFGPGISWPVHYRQDSTGDSWIGGPNVALGGVSFSGGAGVNGDVNRESVFLGGQTVQGGYASLYDDGTPESSQLLWTIDFAPDDFLTQASFYICPWSCSGSAMLLYRLYLPLVIKGM